jgi:hypothetical protein
MAEHGLETTKDEYTKDGTVDLRGNPVLRSKRGGWTACSFVVGKYYTYLVLYTLFDMQLLLFEQSILFV